MTDWKCIAYLPDGTLCGMPASVADPQRRGMICARCAETDHQLEDDSATRAFNRAKRAVEASPILRKYAMVILSDWTQEDAFWQWVAEAREDDVALWAVKAVASYERVIQEKDARIAELEQLVADLNSVVTQQEQIIRAYPRPLSTAGSGSKVPQKHRTPA